VLVDLVSDYGLKPYFTGDKIDDIRVIAVVTVIVLLGIGLMGISYFAKTQGILFVTMVVAIIAVVVGSAFPDFPSHDDNSNKGFIGYPAVGTQNMLPQFSFDPTRPNVEYNFFTVFAVFFPAATGIMAGANIAGDLNKPSEAIPKGTLLAVLITFICYLLLIFVVGMSCLRCTDGGFGHCPSVIPASQMWAVQALNNNTIPMGGLLYNKIIMATLVPVHAFYFFGVFASSLSSALSSLVSAPRILQSVAKDKIFPWAWLRFMAVGSGSGDEPMRALIFTFFITTAVALIGNLDAIATIITNVFLASYALVNYAAFVADRTATAGWRPQFKSFNQWVSLVGCILCIVVMFLIDWKTALLTGLLCAVIWITVGQIEVPVNWGAADDANKYLKTVHGLVSLAKIKHDNVKVYRLQTLCLAGMAGERPSLVKLATMMGSTQGVLLLGDIVVSPLPYDLHEHERHREYASLLGRDTKLIEERRMEDERYLQNKSVWGGRCPNAFYQVVAAPSVLDGFLRLSQAAGIGKVRPNAVLLGYMKDWRNKDLLAVREYELMLRAAQVSGMGVMVARDDQGALNVDMDTRIKSVAQLLGMIKKKIKKPKRKRMLHEQPAVEDDEEMRGGAPSPLEGELPTTVEGETIDVWWLGEDGGFSVLVPHIVQRHALFAGKELRVFTVVDVDGSGETFEQASDRMTSLLFRLRVDAKIVVVDCKLGAAVEDAKKLEEFETLGLGPLRELGDAEQALTTRYMNLGDQLRAHSGLKRAHSGWAKASAVFVTMPLFLSGLPVKLYMSWMDQLTSGMPPTVLIRGTGNPLMTFNA